MDPTTFIALVSPEKREDLFKLADTPSLKRVGKYRINPRKGHPYVESEDSGDPAKYLGRLEKLQQAITAWRRRRSGPVRDGDQAGDHAWFFRSTWPVPEAVVGTSEDVPAASGTRLGEQPDNLSPGHLDAMPSSKQQLADGPNHQLEDGRAMPGPGPNGTDGTDQFQGTKLHGVRDALPRLTDAGEKADAEIPRNAPGNAEGGVPEAVTGVPSASGKSVPMQFWRSAGDEPSEASVPPPRRTHLRDQPHAERPPDQNFTSLSGDESARVFEQPTVDVVTNGAANTDASDYAHPPLAVTGDTNIPLGPTEPEGRESMAGNSVDGVPEPGMLVPGDRGNSPPTDEAPFAIACSNTSRAILTVLLAGLCGAGIWLGVRWAPATAPDDDNKNEVALGQPIPDRGQMVSATDASKFSGDVQLPNAGKSGNSSSRLALSSRTLGTIAQTSRAGSGASADELVTLPESHAVASWSSPFTIERLWLAVTESSRAATTSADVPGGRVETAREGIAEWAVYGSAIPGVLPRSWRQNWNAQVFPGLSGDTSFLPSDAIVAAKEFGSVTAVTWTRHEDGAQELAFSALNPDRLWMAVSVLMAGEWRPSVRVWRDANWSIARRGSDVVLRSSENGKR